MSKSREEIKKELMAKAEEKEITKREADLSMLMASQLIGVEILPHGRPGMINILRDSTEDISSVRLESSKAVRVWVLSTQDCYALLERLIETHAVVSSGRISLPDRDLNDAEDGKRFGSLRTWFILQRVKK